jgi:hypothetical protein
MIAKKGTGVRRSPGRDPRVMSMVMSPGTGTWDPRKRQADRSDVRQEYARLKRPRTGFEPNGQADGRQPFMPQEYLTTPAFEDLSLPFRSCETNAAALLGRVTAPFVLRC